MKVNYDAFPAKKTLRTSVGDLGGIGALRKDT